MSANDIIMSSQGNNINLLKQLPFYGKIIKPRVQGFTNAKMWLNLSNVCGSIWIEFVKTLSNFQ